ncbi:hypothetical protein DC3_00640 [Deinococcus cellulosilyticus NBRC 106333 = KACC 11606]|uniref:Uncharacterized protein n=1 Tax=Deinococcus cellulosilyticus (strain DSM 18568 / NBRC 106333 / KACC 11606 / 5516J-15) TaxID=1223518 RepID=A0A511MV20_DEIC1|nr:hypothetical protein DC3_00640 [Deinococcus cellulosilyticus NBRC 106333 = KACC 11606]
MKDQLNILNVQIYVFRISQLRKECQSSQAMRLTEDLSKRAVWKKANPVQHATEPDSLDG